MERFSIRSWVRILLFNLTLVAAMGVLMRYKIRFEFPFFDQQNIQHAHSHFAFSGWIIQALFVFITALLREQLSPARIKQYNSILWLNLLCSYGMLLSFFMDGYGLFSIIFSTLSIVLTFVFSGMFFGNSAQFSRYPQALKWIKGALVFGMLSSAGTAYLVIMMVTKHMSQEMYLASVYFYLHFQYNGLFFFACIGLFIAMANMHGISIKKDRLAFSLLFYSCIPAYFLSTLWANIPWWLYLLVVFASIAQFTGWIFLLRDAFHYCKASARLSPLCKFLLYFVAIAGTVKFGLQCGSTIPEVSHLAFGFRPIVIAYLHLVLLAFISVLLILYMAGFNLIVMTGWTTAAIVCFALGIFFNELVLGIQGVASFGYIVVPHVNTILLVIGGILFASAFWLLLTQASKSEVIR